MAKSKKPEQAIFYQNFKGAIYGGTPEQVKNLMTAFCQYAFDGIENPTVAPDIVMTFGMMKASVDADRKHYQEVCEQNRINALKKTGLTITGFIQYALDTNEYITFTVDDEEYRFISAEGDSSFTNAKSITHFNDELDEQAYEEELDGKDEYED